MKNTGARVLFIESSTKKNKILIQMLTVLGFNVFTVSNVEEAIHKTITLPPEIILCNEEFEEYNGLQIYSMLENHLLKHAIPFILLLNEYNRDCIAMGEELGIDGFLFPPFELMQIKNILNKRLLKNEVRKSLALKYFQEIWDLIPMGFFIVENKRIINGNYHFTKLLGETINLSKKYFLNEILFFNSHQKEENKLYRFLNGLEKSCCLKDIQLKNQKTDKYNVNLFSLDNHMSALSMRVLFCHKYKLIMIHQIHMKRKLLQRMRSTIMKY